MYVPSSSPQPASPSAGSLHPEPVALAEPHLWLCQSQLGGSGAHQDDPQHAVAPTGETAEKPGEI